MLRPYGAKASVGPGKLVKQFPGRRTSLLALGIPAGRMAIRPYHSGSPFDGIRDAIAGTAHERSHTSFTYVPVRWRSGFRQGAWPFASYHSGPACNGMRHVIAGTAQQPAEMACHVPLRIERPRPGVMRRHAFDSYAMDCVHPPAGLPQYRGFPSRSQWGLLRGPLSAGQERRIANVRGLVSR